MINRIKLWWKFDGKYYHRDFVYGIKNLIRWFKIVWKDRDWDDHFIWVLMMKKLEFQSKYIGDNDRHMSAKRDAEIMRTCVELMKRVKEEYYGIEYMDYHDSDYNWIDCDKPGYKQLDIVENKEWFDDYFKKYPLVYKRVKEKYPDKPKGQIAMYMSMENHNRVRKLLFTLMERNIERWWD